MSTPIRALTTEDLFTVTEMLIDAVDLGASKIGAVMRAETKGDKKQDTKDLEAAGQRAVVVVVKELWAHCKPQMTNWVADLCGMTPDEYMRAPIGVTMDVVEFFTNDEANADFFSRALRVAKKTSGSVEAIATRLGG